MTYREIALELCGGYLDMPSGCDGCPLATDEYDGDGNRICALDTVSRPPAVDVVPVTRCKDCKHAKAPETPPYMLKRPDFLKCGCSGTFGSGGLVYPTDFCSNGKRKEDSDEEV